MMSKPIIQQLSLTFEVNLPNKLIEAAERLDKVSTLYSGDLLENNRIRGIVYQAGLEWVCTGVVFLNGVKEVDLQQLLQDWQWAKPTYQNSQRCRDAYGSIYVGRAIKHRKVLYVLGEQRLKLVKDETAAKKRASCKG
jgi:hypothetical protein